LKPDPSLLILYMAMKLEKSAYESDPASILVGNIIS
jgi:hypothetical protein